MTEAFVAKPSGKAREADARESLRLVRFMEARIRELEAELADAIRIREVNRKLSDDWMARAEKAEARVAELEKAIRSALGEIGDFPGIPEDWPRRPFYWRTWLRQLSGIVFEGERK